MEVHQHTHTPRKKWIHYFWEFLMLFLAVFCGFLAEYQLEHTIEHQREKQYMVTMLEDLKNDTTQLTESISYWNNINNSIDSVSDAIQFPPNNLDLPKAYRHLSNALNYYGFRFNDRTISQLKNSGGFRLIRNKEVANRIIIYDQLNTDPAVKIEGQHNQLYLNTLAIRNKVFVQEIINEVYRRYLYVPPPASTDLWIDSFINKYKIPLTAETYTALLFEFKNSLLALRKDFTNMQWAYDSISRSANLLIPLIKEKYKLK
ncbi:MAG TPA: hypothetical protein VFT15_15785 [Chitinophagaceae bacterium]|nr:hypothetical protein [Chitinophagaceae bacterium]